MKKYLTAITTSLFLLLPATGFAGYVIHLKDGTQFVTDQYFEEGDQIKFKRYGGLFGIAKDRVREIEEKEAPTEPTAKEETSAKTEAPAGASPEADENVEAGKASAKHEASDDEDSKVGEKKEAGQVEAKKAQALSDEQKELVEKYSKEFEGYKAKFKNVDLMPLEDLNEFYKELDTFRKTVVTKRLGSFFENEILEVYLMMEKIQEVMKFKGG